MWWRIHSQNRDRAPRARRRCFRRRPNEGQTWPPDGSGLLPIGSATSGATSAAGAFSFARSAVHHRASRCRTEMLETTATIESARMIGHSCSASDAEFANTAFDTGVNAAAEDQVGAPLGPAHRAARRGDAHRLGLRGRVADHEPADDRRQHDEQHLVVGPVVVDQAAEQEELAVAIDGGVDHLARLRGDPGLARQQAVDDVAERRHHRQHRRRGRTSRRRSRRRRPRPAAARTASPCSG